MIEQILRLELGELGVILEINSGSPGLVACNASMKGLSMVVLLATGWQLPQVRPFPSKVSPKNTLAPAQMV